MPNFKNPTVLAIFSMLGFVALWAILTDAWNYSAILFSNQLLPVGKYLYSYLSRIIWMAPAFLLIFRFDEKLFWNRKQLFSRPKLEPLFVMFIVLTTVYALGSMAVQYHAWHTTKENLLLLTIKLLLVGIGEETVFRGWGYNLLRKTRSDAASLVISALLFVFLHWPTYFIKLFLYGGFDWLRFVSQSISAMICGVLFATMQKRSGTLWNPILAHFYYDWILEVFG